MAQLYPTNTIQGPLKLNKKHENEKKIIEARFAKCPSGKQTISSALLVP
jgi:hypothetical protein